MSAIRGVAACKAKLAELCATASSELAAATTPAQVSDAANRNADALVEFTIDSTPLNPADPAEVAAIAALRDRASQVSEGLAAIAVGASVDAIAARAADIAAIAAALRQETQANVERDRSLRLTPIRDALDRVSDTIASAKALVGTLDSGDPDEQAIIAEIEDLAAKFGALKQTLEAKQD